MPRTLNDNAQKKTALLLSKHAPNGSKIAIMVKGRKNFKKDKKITTKNMPRGKIPRLYYIKGKRFYLSHTLTHSSSLILITNTHKNGTEVFFNLQPSFLESLQALIT